LKELLVIVPVFNEEKNLANLLESLSEPKIRSFADILIINDASSDRTEAIAKSYNMPLITHVFNLGYGATLQVGYKYAVRNNYKYVIQIDGDGQHSVDNIAHIYRFLHSKDAEGNTPDIVIGSRFLAGSKAYKISAIKKLSISYFSCLIKKKTGVLITDPTSGLQGLSRRAFKYYSQYGNFDCSYPDANMIIQMLLLGYRIKETTSVMYERKAGVSMHRGLIKQLIYMLTMPLSIWTVTVRIKKGLQKT
jgi:glycosyltransferase involved in cell wall biosynthesis